MEDTSVHRSANVDSTTELSVDDLFEIVSCIEEVKADYFKIGLALRLKHSTVDGIRKEKLDHAESLYKVIKEWLLKNYNWQKHGKPTWKALAEAVRNPVGGNNTKLAHEIARDHPAGKNSATDHPAGDFRNAVNAPASGLHALASQRSESTSSKASVSSPISIASPGVSLPASLPLVNTSSSSSPDSSSLESDTDLEQQLEYDAKMIQEKYASYVDCIREIVESKGVNPGQLSSFLINLPASNSDRRKKSNLLSHMKDELQKAAEISEIFFSLRAKCASFLDFDIFRTILQHYGIAEKREELEYPSHLKDYLEKLKINEFIRLHPELQNPKLETLCKDSKKIYVKLNIKKTQNLSTIHEVKPAVANILGLKSSSLRLCSVSEGCVLITLLISDAIAENIFISDAIFDSQDIRRFQDVKVMSLECNSCKFDFRNEENSATTTPQPEEMETSQENEEEAKKEIDNLQLIFENIQETMMKMLEKKGFKFKHMKHAICMYPKDVQERGMKVLLGMESLKIVSGAPESPREPDLDDVFSIWNTEFVWSFLDIKLLEYIVKRQGNASLKKTMSQYSKRLTNFKKKTMVSTLVKYWPSSPDRPNDDEYTKCKKLVLKLKLSADLCTLDKLEELRETSCQKLVLSEFALVLVDVKPGSITVVWVLPDKLVEHCEDKLRQRKFLRDFFKQNNITRLELDGGIFPIEEKLRHAASSGNIYMLDDVLKAEWIKGEDDINEPDHEGKTALIRAAEGDHGSIVVSLLESELGIEVDQRAKYKQWTALFFAYDKKHSRIVKLLLEYGADATLEDTDGNTPEKVGGVASSLVQKAGKSVQKLGKAFMDRILPPKKLLTLCKDGRTEYVREYLEGQKNYDINVKGRIGRRKNREWTPLMWACEKGHFEIVKLLLQHKADINIRANNEWMAFHLACSNNHVRIVNLLLKYGADPNSFYTLQSKFTALMYISSMDDMEPLARSLLKFGADPNIPEARLHWTPLTQASYSGKKELVLLYLENKMTDADRVTQSEKTGIIKTDIEMRTDKGWTALTAAIKQDRGEIVDILIDNGISTEMTISKRDSKSEPALHLACYLKCTNAVRVLVRKEGIIDVNQTNHYGLSALMIAIRRKDFRVVEALLESEKIDVNLQQRDTGLTAIFLAAKKGNVRVYEKLLQCGAVAKIDSMSVLDVEGLKKDISAILRKRKTVMEQRQEELATPGIGEEEKSQTTRMESVAPSEATLQMHRLPKKITTMDVNQRLEFLLEEILKKYKKKMEHWKEHGTGSDETEKPEGLPPTEQSSDLDSDTDL